MANRMTLFEKAAAVAAKHRQEDRVRSETQERAYFNERLKEMKLDVLQQLRTFQGKTSPYGAFHLDFIGAAWEVDAFAALYAGDRPVAWFKAAVHQTCSTRTDDTIGDPVTETRIWARLYSPRDSTSGPMDFQEGTGADNGSWTVVCNQIQDLPFFCERLAGILALWLT